MMIMIMIMIMIKRKVIWTPVCELNKIMIIIIIKNNWVAKEKTNYFIFVLGIVIRIFYSRWSLV